VFDDDRRQRLPSNRDEWHIGRAGKGVYEGMTTHQYMYPKVTPIRPGPRGGAKPGPSAAAGAGPRGR
jgi:hypothetical protein